MTYEIKVIQPGDDRPKWSTRVVLDNKHPGTVTGWCVGADSVDVLLADGRIVPNVTADRLSKPFVEVVNAGR